MKNYILTIKQDAGIMNIKVFAEDELKAMDLIISNENCLESAIISVKSDNSIMLVLCKPKDIKSKQIERIVAESINNGIKSDNIRIYCTYCSDSYLHEMNELRKIINNACFKRDNK